MGFFVGQKVVCIDDTTPYEHPCGLGIVRGHVYTVRGYDRRPCHIDGTACIFVDEVVRIWAGKEWSLHASRFRPVTDISDLIQIANEVKTGKPRDIAPDQFDAPRKEKTRAELDVQAFVEWLRAR